MDKIGTYHNGEFAVGMRVTGVVTKLREDNSVEVYLGNDTVGIIPEDYFFYNSLLNNTLPHMIGTEVFVEVMQATDTELILNRRKVQEEYIANVVDKLEPGTILDVKVTTIAPFGVFADMGCGVVGLICAEDVSISRPNNLRDIYIRGMAIKAVYRGVDNLGRYFLSQKELLGTWFQNANKFPIGSSTIGIVRSKMDYGIFIELTPNLIGLAEIDGPVAVNIGDSVKVYIKSAQAEKSKVKLVIADKSEKVYIPTLEYYIQTGVIKEWTFNPENPTKAVRTTYTKVEGVN